MPVISKKYANEFFKIFSIYCPDEYKTNNQEYTISFENLLFEDEGNITKNFSSNQIILIILLLSFSIQHPNKSIANINTINNIILNYELANLIQKFGTYDIQFLNSDFKELDKNGFFIMEGNQLNLSVEVKFGVKNTQLANQNSPLNEHSSPQYQKTATSPEVVILAEDSEHSKSHKRKRASNTSGRDKKRYIDLLEPLEAIKSLQNQINELEIKIENKDKIIHQLADQNSFLLSMIQQQKAIQQAFVIKMQEAQNSVEANNDSYCNFGGLLFTNQGGANTDCVNTSGISEGLNPRTPQV